MKIVNRITFPTENLPKIQNFRQVFLDEIRRQSTSLLRVGNPFVQIHTAKHCGTGFFFQEFRDSFIVATCAHTFLEVNGVVSNTLKVKYRYKVSHKRDFWNRLKNRTASPIEEIVSVELKIRNFEMSDYLKEDILFIQVEKPKNVLIELFNRQSITVTPVPFSFACRLSDDVPVMYGGLFDGELVLLVKDDVHVRQSEATYVERVNTGAMFKYHSLGFVSYDVCKMFCERGASGSPVWNAAMSLGGMLCTAESKDSPRKWSSYTPLSRIEDAFARISKDFK